MSDLSACLEELWAQFRTVPTGVPVLTADRSGIQQRIQQFVARVPTVPTVPTCESDEGDREERAAILEYEHGLTRTAAERAAGLGDAASDGEG